MLSRVVDRPKLLDDCLACEACRAELMEPHIAPLTNFVAGLRGRVGPDLAIPDFDPWDAGIRAQVLLLLEAPGPRAIQSGFVSRNNRDDTAKNLFELNRDAGIERAQAVVWNVVPWYIGNGTRVRAARVADISAAAGAVEDLVALLPELRAVVLLGRKAQRAADLVVRLRPSIRIFRSPHPSPVFMNRAPVHRERILAVFRDVAAYLKADTTAI